jgi:hypothetical protein
MSTMDEMSFRSVGGVSSRRIQIEQSPTRSLFVDHRASDGSVALTIREIKPSGRTFDHTVELTPEVWAEIVTWVADG